MKYLFSAIADCRSAVLHNSIVGAFVRAFLNFQFMPRKSYSLTLVYYLPLLKIRFSCPMSDFF